MSTNSDVPALIKEGQRLLKQGDKEGADNKFLEAGQRLYDRHGGKLLAQCIWKWGDAGKDIVQEIFQLLWQKMPELEHPEAVEGWLYTVRNNKVLQNGRNAGRRNTILAERHRAIAESAHCVPVASPENIVISRDEEQEQRDILRQLPRVLEQLDPAEVTLLRMRFHLGLGFADIGTALGFSEATARRRLRHALEGLNEKLQEQRETP